MLNYNDLKAGVFFIYEGQPYEVLESQILKMQQRRPVFQTKMRNLINGKVIENNFQQSDMLQEADVERKEVKFLYAHRGEFWFVETEDASKRFKLDENIICENSRFLKQNTPAEAILCEEKIIKIELPVKMDFKVIEAPPAIRGNTAQGGAKQVVLESGATFNVPLFINEGDIIRINTQTGQYVERVTKE